jgi:hypothetical protein
MVESVAVSIQRLGEGLKDSLDAIIEWLRKYLAWEISGAIISIVAGIVGQVLMGAAWYLSSEVCFGLAGFIGLLWAICLHIHPVVRAILSFLILGITALVIGAVYSMTPDTAPTMDGAIVQIRALPARHLSDGSYAFPIEIDNLGNLATVGQVAGFQQPLAVRQLSPREEDKIMQDTIDKLRFSSKISPDTVLDYNDAILPGKGYILMQPQGHYNQLGYDKILGAVYKVIDA